MGVGAHSVTSMVASCRKGQKRPKRAKKPNQKFQGQERSKNAKFDLFGLA